MKKFVELQTRKALKNDLVKRAPVSYEKVKKIGILFSAEDRKKFDHIKSFYLALKGEGLEVDVLSYLARDRENHEFLFEIFRTRDFTFWGQFQSPVINEFVNKEFDYLYHLDLESNSYVDRILASSKAKCRVGRHVENRKSYYELMFKLNEQEGIKSFIDQINYYTHRITYAT